MRRRLKQQVIFLNLPPLPPQPHHHRSSFFLCSAASSSSCLTALAWHCFPREGSDALRGSQRVAELPQELAEAVDREAQARDQADGGEGVGGRR